MMWRFVFAGLAVLAGLVLGGLLYLIGGSVVEEVGSHLPTAVARKPPADSEPGKPKPPWLARKMAPPPRIELPYAKATQPEQEGPEQKPREPEKPKRFYRIVAQDAGTLTSGKTTIRLADVQALGPDETCKGEGGKTWPCGRRARSALRRLIRAKSVVCSALERPAANELVARCAVGRVDINDWVVRHGWARPSSSEKERYAAALAAAKKAGRGLWRDAR